MKTHYRLKIGSRGEIFLPKEVREDLDLKKNQSILIKVYPNRLIIQKADSLEEILSQPSDNKISYHMLKNLKNEFD